MHNPCVRQQPPTQRSPADQQHQAATRLLCYSATALDTAPKHPHNLPAWQPAAHQCYHPAQPMRTHIQTQLQARSLGTKHTHSYLGWLADMPTTRHAARCPAQQLALGSSLSHTTAPGQGQRQATAQACAKAQPTQTSPVNAQPARSAPPHTHLPVTSHTQHSP